MTILTFTLAILGTSLLAGLLGALTGLGGGVVVVPVLALLFHVDLRYAIGASLISVIATSSGSAAAYVRGGLSNVRIGLFLEIATCIGAIVGALMAAFVPTHGLAILFGVVLLYSAYASKQHDHPTKSEPAKKNSLGERLRLNGAYPDGGGWTKYSVIRVPLGFGIMMVAGILSGL